MNNFIVEASEYPAALVELVDERLKRLTALQVALSNFIETGCESEGSADEHEHGGKDPDDVDYKSVEPNGEIYEAVVAIRPFYGGSKLSFPAPRNHWQRLQRICRDKSTERYDKQNWAHEIADEFLCWVTNEISPNKNGKSTANRLEIGDSDERWVLVELADCKLTRKTIGLHAKDESKPFIRKLHHGQYEVLKSQLHVYIEPRFLAKYPATGK